MLWHRPLAELLTDVHEAVQSSAPAEFGIRATHVHMRLPIEVWLKRQADELEFIGDLPVWRWRTVFDQVPGQIRIVWEEACR